MGFSFQGVWVMGYCGLMGYGLQIPANQPGGPNFLWVIRGYGFSQAWVMRVSTVYVSKKNSKSCGDYLAHNWQAV